MKAVLEAYRANGGSYDEEIIDDAGHTPYLEKPGEFREALLGFLEKRG